MEDNGEEYKAMENKWLIIEDSDTIDMFNFCQYSECFAI